MGLDYAELMIAIEETFHQDISKNERWFRIKTVGDLIDLVHDNIKERNRNVTKMEPEIEEEIFQQIQTIAAPYVRIPGQALQRTDLWNSLIPWSRRKVLNKKFVENGFRPPVSSNYWSISLPLLITLPPFFFMMYLAFSFPNWFGTLFTLGFVWLFLGGSSEIWLFPPIFAKRATVGDTVKDLAAFRLPLLKEDKTEWTQKDIEEKIFAFVSEYAPKKKLSRETSFREDLHFD